MRQNIPLTQGSYFRPHSFKMSSISADGEETAGGFYTLYFRFLNTWSLSKEGNIPYSDENFNLRIKIPYCNYSWKTKNLFWKLKKKWGFPKTPVCGKHLDPIQVYFWASLICKHSGPVDARRLRNFHSSLILNLYTVSVITFGCNPFDICLTKNISQSLSVLHELDIFEKLRELVLDNIWVSVLW